ncbi:MAG: SEC-C domain-containing protein [Desulfobulbaceae bacterium]|nr:SEC-C domain-containing protein [Desulfobulbaceae bacterium]
MKKMPGRNEPCHCGSGKKYKKCCLPKDEDEQRRQQNVKSVPIDPFAGDDDWEEEPVPARAEIPEDDRMHEDFAGETVDPLFAGTAGDDAVARPEKKKLSDAEEAIIDAWWAAYRDMSDPDILRGHLENFMSSHPGLVAELGLDREPLFELESMYVRQDRHKEYIDILSRLRLEFPDAYFKGFAYFDNAMATWLVINGRKGEVAEYLADFRRYPDDDPDNLFEVIHFLMSWNCQDILADFIPAICHEVCTSPLIMGGGEILVPMTTLIMAPYLDQGLDGCDPDELAAALRKIGDELNPIWTDSEFLQRRLHLILGRHEQWNLDGCHTRPKAMSRYDEMTSSFMGWLAARKNLDWCAAEYHRQLVLDYLSEALPKKKKPRQPFPFAEKNMERLLVSLSKKMLWLDSTRLFGLLNGIHWFLEFLEDTRSLEAEQARLGREACVHFFERVYQSQRKQDFKALAWERFPRDQ